ncbi:tRNA N(3)-methylcytidine methyltransferase METTL6 [Aricia agestis]|uniref:tRNA N(3)-methylcytidine methyltransferase METTL6 n=1 Tax=Aricia agestis TaxID=91739 RepID=UPI001C203F42|nr:tRNA N(3)-methylcytidine methyltransferase METTL6 [Aricia agestis]XP_041973867.1 tRNA N(3)-methylcytidine methyltransferase METTL6 [Aricia agestis]XP_041973868.1 tRNA N(3)-methylcytidine methyltransferase METTL6 [Aricia agestis]XP_041973869.1 tRNA N(3)-methylcytidine methyltransferase METTL6 [Aricia agestis]
MESDEYVGSNGDVFVHRLKELTDEEKQRLEAQNSLVIPETKAARLEKEAKRHWDIFYKRNETKFFRDRHWTTREFQELINFDPDKRIVYLELGCGVGNMIFPLIEEGFSNFFFYACDFSPRAVDFVKANKLYDESRIKAFCADLTTDNLFENMEMGSADMASLIFVLSAIHPNMWAQVASVAHRALRPGGILFFRDYGRYDMAQLRFKAGHKIAENFYMRQDGTRSYYFTEEELEKLFVEAGFEVLSNTYVQRRTVNFKEGIDVPRIFVQGKYRKPDK